MNAEQYIDLIKSNVRVTESHKALMYVETLALELLKQKTEMLMKNEYSECKEKLFMINSQEVILDILISHFKSVDASNELEYDKLIKEWKEGKKDEGSVTE